MEGISGWLGDIHAVGSLDPASAGLICLAASALCGAAIGLERERRDKPAGLRTVLLICLGSTMFTIVSLLIASQKATADPARLAAQILPGIGFLGAGAILRSHGTILGLTTGATIWAAAAVGVTIGAGYVVPAIVFTGVILVVLTLAQHLDAFVAGRCVLRSATIVFRPEGGKTRQRVQAILDRHRVADAAVRSDHEEGGLESAGVEVCTVHREHRALLHELAELHGVVELRLG